MYFIRMMLLLLVLITMCSGSGEIPLDRAEQSSTNGPHIAARAIDNNLSTGTNSGKEDPAWLRAYFSRSTVERVVIAKGFSYSATCVFTVSVYDGETETVCGKYTTNYG